MENHVVHDDQTKILSVNVDARKLRKELLHMPGVNSVSIDAEKNLLFVTGPVDAMTLINNVAKLDIRVHLLPNIKLRKKTGVHIEEIPAHDQYEPHRSHDEGYSSNTTSHQHKGNMHERSPRPRRKHRKEAFDFYENPTNLGNGPFKPHRQREKTNEYPRHQGQSNCAHHKKEEAVEEEHKCEAYEPFAFSERTCRDFYCLKHPSMRDLVGNVHASDDGSSLMRTSPFLGNFGAGGFPYGGSYYGNPGMYGVGPPQYYGYNYQHPRMLQRPFGFQ